MSYYDETPKPTVGRRFLAFADKFEDGAVLRVAFFVMLFSTAWVLWLDYAEMNDATAASDGEQTVPILPAVERPELDPDNPAYRPAEHITTDEAVLRQPMEISLVPGGILRLSGTITPDSAERLGTELAARGEYVQTVSLDSPGGAVTAALQMGELIRAGGYNTLVGGGALCASSCPLVFAGGNERHASARALVGVHQIYTTSQGASTAQALSDAQVITARITRHLDAMQIAPELWLHALDTPPDRLYYLTSDELADLNLATDILAD